MKLFIAIISLLLGIIIGSAITAVLVVKKNNTIKNFLCTDYKVEPENYATSSLMSIISSTLNEGLKSSLKPQTQNNSTSTPESNFPGFSSASSTSSALQNTEGPGGCKNEDDCLKYCSVLDHLQECIAFVKKYGIVKQNVEQPKK